MPVKKIKKLRKEISSQVKKKGHERLTIMVIPHEGQKLFSLQVNWWLICFVCGSLGMLTFLTLFGFYNKYRNAHEREHLLKRYGNNLQNAIKLNQLAKDSITEYKTLLSSLQKIAHTIGVIHEETTLLRSERSARKKAIDIIHDHPWIGKEKRLNPRSDFLPPIYTIKSFHEYMEGQLPLLNTLYFLASQGLSIYDNIPLGRPFRKFLQLRDTSGFGNRVNPIHRAGLEFHGGYDIAGPVGAFVLATANGVVHKSSYHPNGYGRMIIIKHGFGFFSSYAHLSRILVKVGTRIAKRQQIGVIGNSGRTTGTHLHYEVRMGYQNRINPKPYICAGDFYSNACLRYHKIK